MFNQNRLFSRPPGNIFRHDGNHKTSHAHLRRLYGEIPRMDALTQTKNACIREDGTDGLPRLTRAVLDMVGQRRSESLRKDLARATSEGRPCAHHVEQYDEDVGSCHVSTLGEALQTIGYTLKRCAEAGQHYQSVVNYIKQHPKKHLLLYTWKQGDEIGHYVAYNPHFNKLFDDQFQSGAEFKPKSVVALAPPTIKGLQTTGLGEGIGSKGPLWKVYEIHPTPPQVTRKPRGPTHDCTRFIQEGVCTKVKCPYRHGPAIVPEKTSVPALP